MSSEAIEALPIRDVSELYSLQSGVVKVEAGTKGGIPDAEDRGLEEVHVRGGRSGEIAYLIDGMYIRNPIYKGSFSLLIEDPIDNKPTINSFAERVAQNEYTYQIPTLIEYLKSKTRFILVIILLLIEKKDI